MIRYYAQPQNIPWTFAIRVGRYSSREKLAVMAEKTPLARWVPAQYKSLKLIRLQSATVAAKPDAPATHAKRSAIPQRLAFIPQKKYKIYMSVTGTVKNGVVVLPPGTIIPEGAMVTVETMANDEDAFANAVEKLAKPRPAFA